jgi:uncharacterized protein with HEPN domain
MLRAIADAENIVAGKNFSSFQNDRTAVLATLACVQILGEASNHIPEDVKVNYSSIPWNEIRGMRNRITHAYFEVDESILWETIKSDFPVLKMELQKIKS